MSRPSCLAKSLGRFCIDNFLAAVKSPAVRGLFWWTLSLTEESLCLLHSAYTILCWECLHWYCSCLWSDYLPASNFHSNCHCQLKFSDPGHSVLCLLHQYSLKITWISINIWIQYIFWTECTLLFVTGILKCKSMYKFGFLMHHQA